MRGAAISWTAVFLALATLAGCASDLEILPPTPAAPDPLPAAPASIPAPPRGEGLLDAAVHGERILEGVVLLHPEIDMGTGEAAFALRNEGPEPLPDLIVVVVFAVPTGNVEVPFRPRIVTLEAPLARGEERSFRASPPPGLAAPPGRFRVLAGPPGLLAAAAGPAEGTTFLGGLLECVALETDLTGAAPRVVVGLRDRVGGAASVLPPLEGQLLLARGGGLIWSGPWILVPRGDPAEGGVRTIRWNLPGEVSLAGCSPFLRIREKR